MQSTFKRFLTRLAAISAASWLATLAPAATFEFGDLPLTVPDGFVVEQVAAPPLVERPVTCDFDERGGLYVAESSGSNSPLAEQQRDPQHRILRLEDRDGDGVFDHRTVFADGLMMLQGTLWHDGSLYVAAAPQILKLTDHDGDGVADVREIWHDGGTLTGCGNDLHGPYLAPNGRIEFTKGAFAEQTHDLVGRPGWTTRASHVFRCRPDGTELEAVVTGGMDNPVDVAFTAAGERLLSATFLVHPSGGQRDGVIHAVYGGVFGKDHRVIDGHSRTGDLLPILIHLGPAAACGLHVHSGFGVGGGLAGDAFVCSFNLRGVSRHRLIPEGGTFRVESEPFLSGDSADFHPTDVIEDADGSLLVVDTGGWYKLCCPTSQLEKPAVTGAIYRIRRADVARPSDPRGEQIPWSSLSAGALADFLADDRPAVAWQAIAKLGREEACGSVMEKITGADVSETCRLRGVWCLARMDTAASKQALRDLLSDRDVSVRQAAAHALGLLRDTGAIPGLADQLVKADPAVARAAAEALGRIGGEQAVAALLAGSRRGGMRMLDHSIAYALIEAGCVEPVLAALSDADPHVRRTALVALEPLLAAANKESWLDSLRMAAVSAVSADDPLLRDAGLNAMVAHPGWSVEIHGELPKLLDQLAGSSPDDGDRLASRLASLTVSADMANALADVLRDDSTAASGRMAAAMHVMRLARPAMVPQSWVEGLGRHLPAENAAARSLEQSVLAAAVETLAAVALSESQREQVLHSLLRVAAAADLPAAINLAGLRASGLTSNFPAAVQDRLLTLIETNTNEASPLERSAAIDAVVQATLSEADLLRLGNALGQLAPSDAARVLPLLTRSGGPALARALQLLAESPHPELLPRHVVVEAVERLAAQGGATFDLVSRMDTASMSQRQRYQELAASLPAGDAARGHRVFLSQKAACTTCHAMAYAGGRIGPDLTRIGSIRTPADLLEAIVLPNASFVRSYEPVLVLTTKGTVVSGIPQDLGPDEVAVQTSATVCEVIPREQVESIERGAVSLMPSGYDTLLTPQELADLVAFLVRAR